MSSSPEPEKIPPLVQIGLNLIGVLAIDDKTHSWTGLVIMHVFWDPTPFMKGHAFFRPWIQVHNVKTVEELENPGMIHLSDEMLTEKVQRNDTNVHESRNFVADFINELDLRDFPFDCQQLRITVISNTTTQTTFTHKMGKREPSKRMLASKPATSLPIKCNLEADLLSEWSVLLNDGRTMEQGETEPGVSSIAAVNYSFSVNDKALSAMGAMYQRMDMYLMAVREIRHIMFSICFPSVLLTASSLCVYAVDDIGARFGILFTIILTIIAMQFTTQDRLPNLSYYTWMDMFLMSLQIFVYLMVIETAVFTKFAMLVDMPVEEVDLIAMYISIVIYVANFAFFVLRAMYLRSRRDRKVKSFLAESKKCFEREEARLHQLYYPGSPPLEDFTPAKPMQPRNSATAAASKMVVDSSSLDALTPLNTAEPGQTK